MSMMRACGMCSKYGCSDALCDDLKQLLADNLFREKLRVLVESHLSDASRDEEQSLYNNDQP